MDIDRLFKEPSQQFQNLNISDNELRSAFQSLFAHTIQYGGNFSFIKAGDGEFQCMNGFEGENCDNHPYSKELGNELREAYEYFEDAPRVLVSQFPYIEPFLQGYTHQGLFEMLLFMDHNDTHEFVEMWRTIRNTKRKKHFIGNKTVAMEIFDKLNIDSIIEVPEKNAYAAGLPIDQIMKLVKANDIVLISAGFVGKVLAHFIHKAFEGKITILDTGSAFDPLVKNTRSGQMSKENAEEVFKRIVS